MRLILVGVLAFAFTGCTFFKSSGCEVSKGVSSLVAANIASLLTCKNVDAISAALDAELAKTKICEASAQKSLAVVETQSAIGLIICEPVINALSTGVLAQLPASWECSGGPLTDGVRAKLLEACQKAL